jgi:hypothetical protein
VIGLATDHGADRDQRVEAPALRHPLQRDGNFKGTGHGDDGGFRTELLRLLLGALEQPARQCLVEPARDDAQAHMD